MNNGPKTSRPPFIPSGFMKARDEISDTNFLLWREYFLREKELNYENFQNSKSKWKGDALLTTRKLKQTQLPKWKEKYVKQSSRQYLNNQTNYKTFLVRTFFMTISLEKWSKKTSDSRKL